MNKKKILSAMLALVLALSAAGCAAKTPAQPEETTPPEETAQPEETTQPEETAKTDGVFENGGMRLTVPADYVDLLKLDVPQNDEEGILFTVSEKASVEAAEKQGEDTDGAGWLFSIGRVSAEKMEELRHHDMSGIEIFAEGADGSHYVYYHPTDVRFVRENYDNIEEQMKDWTMLNEWAWGEVRDTFVADNAGLTAETVEEIPQEAPQENNGMRFVGTWACGRATITIAPVVDGSFGVFITWSSNAAEHSEWIYQCAYDPDTDTLVSDETGTMKTVVFNEKGEVETSEENYTDGAATFAINEDGKLTWTDAKEDAGLDMEFENVEIVDTTAAN